MSFHLQLRALFQPQVEQAQKSAAEPATDAFRALFEKLARSLTAKPVSTAQAQAPPPEPESESIPGDTAPQTDNVATPLQTVPTGVPALVSVDPSRPKSDTPTVAPATTDPDGPTPVKVGAPAPVVPGAPVPAELPAPAHTLLETFAAVQAEPARPTPVGLPVDRDPVVATQVDRPAVRSAPEPVVENRPAVDTQRPIVSATRHIDPRPLVTNETAGRETPVAVRSTVSSTPAPIASPDVLAGSIPPVSIGARAETTTTTTAAVAGRVATPVERIPSVSVPDTIPESTSAAIEPTARVMRSAPPAVPVAPESIPEVQASVFHTVSRLQREKATPGPSTSAADLRSLPQRDGFEPFAGTQPAILKNVPVGPRRVGVFRHVEANVTIPAPTPESERAPVGLPETSAQVVQRSQAPGSDAPFHPRHDVEPTRLIVEPSNATPPAVETTLGRTESPLPVDRAPAVPIRAEQLAQTILSQARNLEANAPVELRFALHPQELGTVRIRIHVSGKHLHVELVAQNSGATSVLNTGVPRLVQQLQAAGFPDAEVTLTLDTSSDPSPQQRNGGRENGHEPGPANRDQAPPRWYEPGYQAKPHGRDARGRLDRMA